MCKASDIRRPGCEEKSRGGRELSSAAQKWYPKDDLPDAPLAQLERGRRGNLPEH